MTAALYDLRLIACCAWVQAVTVGACGGNAMYGAVIGGVLGLAWRIGWHMERRRNMQERR